MLYRVPLGKPRNREIDQIPHLDSHYWIYNNAYLEQHMLQSGISKIQCCPCPKSRCQRLSVGPLSGLSPFCVSQPVGSASGLWVRVQSGLHVCYKPSTHASNLCQTCPRVTLSFSPCDTNLPLLALLPPSDWGSAGIKQLNAWADYFRDSLSPVQTSVTDCQDSAEQTARPERCVRFKREAQSSSF